jgi:phosphoketolase
LRFVAVPGILLAVDVTVVDRFMLELVAAEAPGERIFGPDNLAADGKTGCLQRILKLTLRGGGMTNI